MLLNSTASHDDIAYTMFMYMSCSGNDPSVKMTVHIYTGIQAQYTDRPSELVVSMNKQR